VTIDPPPRPEVARLLGLDRRSFAARDLLDVRLHVGQRAANADARVPGRVNELRDDLEPKATVVGDDDQLNLPERATRRLISRALRNSRLTIGE
jgi:hypothetical protein